MNKFTFFALTAVLIQASSMSLGALNAFASHDGSDVTVASLRQERNRSNIKIQGFLSCNMGGENNGQGCALKLKDNTTGKIFNLSNATDAMRLFVTGTKNVAVEGKLADSETLQIASVSAL
jgi:hypothetical protein